MLLKKENGRRLSAVSLCLAMTFAPLFTAAAGEPELVPSDSSALPAEPSPVLLQPGAQSPVMANLVGTKPLELWWRVTFGRQLVGVADENIGRINMIVTALASLVNIDIKRQWLGDALLLVAF